MPGSHWLGNPGGVSLLPRESFNWLISGDQAPLSVLARGEVEADQATTPPESVPQHVSRIFVNAADDCWPLSSPHASPQPRRAHIAGLASAACSPTLEPLSSPRAPDAILHMLLEARDSALKLGEEAHLFRAHRCRSMQRDTESQRRSGPPEPGPGMGDSVSLSSYLTSQQHASGGHVPTSVDGACGGNQWVEEGVSHVAWEEETRVEGDGLEAKALTGSTITPISRQAVQGSKMSGAKSASSPRTLQNIARRLQDEL